MFRTSLVVHHQEHYTIYCITQFGTIVLSDESSYCEVLGKTLHRMELCEIQTFTAVKMKFAVLFVFISCRCTGGWLITLRVSLLPFC